MGLLGLTAPMERLFRRNVELLRENGGRVAAPVTKGDTARISMLLENAWAQLSDQEKAAASTVGYSEEMWASFGSLGGSALCRPTTKSWGDLSPNEKVRSVPGARMHAWPFKFAACLYCYRPQRMCLVSAKLSGMRCDRAQGQHW